jgi:chromosome segregation ATPase
MDSAPCGFQCYQFEALTISGELQIEPDAVLSELDRLQKSPEDLADAVELLNQRRAWAEQLSAGDAAEQEYPKLLRQVQKGEDELKAMTAQIQKKMAPIHQRRSQAMADMQAGTSARRNLIDTAGEECRDSALADVKQEIEETEHARANLGKRIADRQAWIRDVTSRGQNASTPDLQRLEDRARHAELAEWREQDRELSQRMTELQTEFAQAHDVLLEPESI